MKKQFCSECNKELTIENWDYEADMISSYAKPKCDECLLGVDMDEQLENMFEHEFEILIETHDTITREEHHIIFRLFRMMEKMNIHNEFRTRMYKYYKQSLKI